MNKKLNIFINGVAEFEIFFNLAKELHRKIDIEVYAPKTLLKREPRIKSSFNDAPFKTSVKRSFILKHFFHSIIKPNEYHLTLTDPTIDNTNYKKRTKYILKNGGKFIFIQHGIIQTYVNYFTADTKAQKYVSDLILLYSDLDYSKFAEEERISFDGKETKAVGYLRQFPELIKIPNEVKNFVSKFDEAILLCHSFRWKGDRFTSKRENFYKIVEELADKYPNKLFIIRPHRGKNKGESTSLNSKPNVIYSLRKSGMLAGYNINDVLQICSCMISVPSSCIMDSIYSNKPVAVYFNDSEIYQSLPSANTLAEFELFLENKDIHSEEYQQIRKTYGTSINDNVKKSATAIINHITNK